MTLAQERDVWEEYGRAEGEERSQLENELVKQHKGLAHFTARKYFSSQYEPEDILQTALLGLLKAIRGFNPQEGSQFSTYAIMTMRRDIGHLIRDQYADKRKIEMATVSIHTPINRDGEQTITIMDGLPDHRDGPEGAIEAEGMRQLIAQGLQNANKKHRRYFLDHMSGMTLKQVAEAHEVSYREVQMGVYRAKRAIKDLLEELQ